MAVYDFSWTPSAKSYAIVHRIEADILIATMRELALVPDDESLDGAVSFEIGEQLFVGIGKGDGHIVIDTAKWVEGPLLSEGPFKGRVVMLPTPDTAEESWKP